MMVQENWIKIGLVDDHQMFRTALGSYLEKSKSNISVVLQADNGRNLLDQLATCDASVLPSIILLDIQMPVMNGIQTLLSLKKEYPRIKVIMLTMYSDDNTILSMIKLGADAYLTKDTPLETVEFAIEETKRSGKYITSYITDLLMESLRGSGGAGDPAESENELTERERELLKYMCSELTYQQIAEQMFVSVRTIDTMRDRIFKKLNVFTRVGAVLWALRSGFGLLDMKEENERREVNLQLNIHKKEGFSKE